MDREGRKERITMRRFFWFDWALLFPTTLTSFAVSVGGGLAVGKILEDSPLRQAPRLVDRSADELPRAELLATPEVPTFLGYTRRVLHLHDGHTLGVFSFSGAAEANWLFLIDSRDLSVERYNLPNNDIASHGAALGADGHIYIMPYGNGRAYRFDVETRQFEPLETGLPAGEYTWEAWGAANGRIYFGTYPNAYLGEYDPVRGECTLWKQVAPNTKYTTTFSEDLDGHIRFKAWGPDQVWLVFDPQTRRLEPGEPPGGKGREGEVLPNPPAGDDHFPRVTSVEGRRFALSFPSSRLWEVSPAGELTLRGDPQSPAEPWYLEAVPGAVIGISYFGTVFRHLIPDQNLPTLAYDPVNRLLWGGTDRWGQMRSHPPTQDSSLIYAFDPASRQVVATLTPWPGADVTSVLGVSANGVLIAASGQEIALIDAATREILSQGPSPLGLPNKVLRGSDGFCYCLSNGTLYRWDLTQNLLTPMATSPGCVFLTEPAPGVWVMANSASVYRVRLS